MQEWIGRRGGLDQRRMRSGLREGVGAGEVGVAGEGVAVAAVDEETDGGDGGEVGVKGLEDGVEGEGLDLDAGGVVVGKGAVKVDDGELAGVAVEGRGFGVG